MDIIIVGSMAGNERVARAEFDAAKTKSRRSGLPPDSPDERFLIGGFAFGTRHWVRSFLGRACVGFSVIEARFAAYIK